MPLAGMRQTRVAGSGGGFVDAGGGWRAVGVGEAGLLAGGSAVLGDGRGMAAVVAGDDAVRAVRQGLGGGLAGRTLESPAGKPGAEDGLLDLCGERHALGFQAARRRGARSPYFGLKR